MDHQKLSILANKLMLKINTTEEYIEYLKLHAQLHKTFKVEKFNSADETQ